MIKLTGIDPWAYVYYTWEVSIVLDNVSHVSQFIGRDSNKVGAAVHMNSGNTIYVTESVDVVSKRLREYAENDQKERMHGWIAEEVAKLVTELADKAWRYDENSR